MRVRPRIFLTVLFLVVATMNVYAGKKLPRVMVMMSERNVGSYSVEQAETTMVQFLIDQGYTTIDPEMIKTKTQRDQRLQAMTGDAQAAAAIGLEFGADIVIVGRAVAKGSASTIGKTDMRSYHGTVTAKAIATDTAKIIATAQGSAKQPHLDDTAGGSAAIKAASEKAVAALAKKLNKALGIEAAKGKHKVQVVVADVKQVWQLAALKRMLQEKVDGVTSVDQRNFVTGIATFDLTGNQDAEALSKSLILIPDESLKLKVIGVSPGKIDAKLVVVK